MRSEYLAFRRFALRGEAPCKFSMLNEIPHFCGPM